LLNSELSYIHVSELKVAAFTYQVDDLVVPISAIWPYQFFNVLWSDSRFEITYWIIFWATTSSAIVNSDS